MSFRSTKKPIQSNVSFLRPLESFQVTRSLGAFQLHLRMRKLRLGILYLESSESEGSRVKIMQGDGGLPLEDDELLGVSSLQLVEGLDKVAVTVLANMVGAQVRQLILALDVMDADLALLHQFLHEKIPQCDVFYARTGGAVADDVLSIYSGALPKLSSKPISNIMLERNTASFIVRASATSSASIVDCAVSPRSPSSKLIGRWPASRCLMT